MKLRKFKDKYSFKLNSEKKNVSLGQFSETFCINLNSKKHIILQQVNSNKNAVLVYTGDMFEKAVYKTALGLGEKVILDIRICIEEAGYENDHSKDVHSVG